MNKLSKVFMTFCFMATIFLAIQVQIVTVENKELSNKINLQEQQIDVLEHFTRANFYKRDAMLYLMNVKGNSQYVKKLLADSCKQACIDYRNSGFYNN